MPIRRTTALIAIGALALAGAAAGCGDDDDETAGTSATTAAEATAGTAPAGGTEADGAAVSFVSPDEGAEVSQPVTAAVRLTGFRLSAANVGKPAREGQGHLHFTMDGGRYDQPRYSGPNGELAVKLGVQGKYSPSVTPEITYRNLPPGEHTLVVHLANNDHSDAGPTARTTFTVR